MVTTGAHELEREPVNHPHARTYESHEVCGITWVTKGRPAHTAETAMEINGNGYPNNLWGTLDNDRISGYDDDDSLHGLGGDDALFGGLGQDRLYGDWDDDYLEGGSGHDLLDGGDGADRMFGGSGNDTYVVDNVRDSVTERAGEGTDTVTASISYTLGAHVEHLTLTGSAAINGTGNSLDNIIIGNAGANTLDGGIGADGMRGGAGDDTYVVDDASDAVSEQPGEGSDTVQSSISYTLGAHVENLELTGTATRGTGNALNNILAGNDLGNTLTGGDGNDTLIGAGGSDVLTGGPGSDLFRFNAPTDGGVKGGDSITDFITGQDRIALDHGGFGLAGTGSLASQGVDFVRGSAATINVPTVIVTPFSNDVWWDADGTGASAAQLLAHVSLPAFATLGGSDFLVV